MANKEYDNTYLLDQVRRLELPLGKYAISSSGVIGVRNLKQMGDVDILVDDELWVELASCGTLSTYPRKKLQLGSDIEVLYSSSFPLDVDGVPTVGEQIRCSEVTEGLAFVSLEHVLFFKKQMARPKDIIDIQIIESIVKDLI